MCRAVPVLFPALASAPAYPLDPAASPLVEVRADVWRAPPFSSRLHAAVPVVVVTAAAPNGNGRLPLAVSLQGPAYERVEPCASDVGPHRCEWDSGVKGPLGFV